MSEKVLERDGYVASRRKLLRLLADAEGLLLHELTPQFQMGRIVFLKKFWGQCPGKVKL